eukprot:1145113-Pelagomonas_calceolata.AAC.1
MQMTPELELHSRQDADLELMEAMRPHIVSGEPNTERKSTFQVWQPSSVLFSSSNLKGAASLLAVPHACLVPSSPLVLSLHHKRQRMPFKRASQRLQKQKAFSQSLWLRSCSLKKRSYARKGAVCATCLPWPPTGPLVCVTSTKSSIKCDSRAALVKKQEHYTAVAAYEGSLPQFRIRFLLDAVASGQLPLGKESAA